MRRPPLLAFALAAAAAGPALAASCDPSNQAWQWSAARATLAGKLQAGATDAALANQAMAAFQERLDLIDGFKPYRSVQNELEVLLLLEQEADRFDRCGRAIQAAGLPDVIPHPRAVAWRNAIAAKLLDLDTAFGGDIEKALLDSFSDDLVARVKASPAMMALIARRHPTLMERVRDSQVAAAERSDPEAFKREQEKARQAEIAAAAARAAQRQAAAFARLAPAYGLWRKVDGQSYRRAGPGGIVVTLSCLAGTGDGLFVELRRPGGAFVRPVGTQINPEGVGVAVKTPTGTVSSNAKLKMSGSDTSTSHDYWNHTETTTHTTYYDPSIASFTITSRAGLETVLRYNSERTSGVMAGLDRALGGFGYLDALGRGVAALTTGLSPMMVDRMMQTNINLAGVRDQPSGLLTVTVAEGPPITLFDLKPAAPPFSAMLATCGIG